MAPSSHEKPNKPDDFFSRYTFEINCEGMIRIVTIQAESKAEAEKIVKIENPDCNIKLKWMHE
jgi:hypothetical protein